MNVRRDVEPPIETGLIGRQRELAAVEAVLRRAAGGEGGALVIVGEPGVGKSALLAEVGRSVGEGRHLHARGVVSESVLPFSGLQQLAFPVRHLIERLPAPQGQALRVAMGLEEVRETDPYLVSLAALSLVSEAAAAGPVLVTVDDFQWLDPASGDAILLICRRVATEPVAVILAARSDEWASVGDHDIPMLELDGLDDAGVSALVARRAETRPHEEVARRLASASGGNPLAVIEVTARLTDDQLHGRVPLPANLPISRGLQRAFGVRLSELPADVQTVLLVVAADDTGHRALVDRATEALGLDGGLVDHGIAEDLLVARGDGVDFRHPVIRSAVYDRATPTDRRRVHAALANVLGSRDPDRATWHRAAAVDGTDGDVAAQLTDLAHRSRVRGAHAEAMSAWERAADLTARDAGAAEALLEGADAGWSAGRLDRAVALLDRLGRLDLSEAQRTRATWIRGGIELASGDALRAYRTLVEAAGSRSTTDPERALHILNVAAEAASLANDRLATADLGRHAPSVGEDASVRARLLSAAILGFAADFAGDVQAAAGHLRRTVALAGDVDEPALQLIAGRAAIYVGDDEAARALHLAVIEDARRRGSVDLVPIAAPRLATAEMLLGRWASAAATAEESSRLADETGQLLLAPHGRATLAILAALRGDGESMERHLADALRAVRDRPMGLIEDDAHWARGLLALGEGRHAEALEHLARITHPVVQLLSSQDRVEAAAACGDDRIAEWQAVVTPLATADGPAWARARESCALALRVPVADDAWGHYTAALDAAGQAGRPFERARIQLAAGSFLRRQRRRIDARTHLRPAAATFDMLGARPWADRAHAELRATGETLARSGRPSLDRLTPQELQVARAVAGGSSNREVAAHLFLSPRTVEFHLRNVFAKLEVTSRVQLARIDLEDPGHSR